MQGQRRQGYDRGRGAWQHSELALRGCSCVFLPDQEGDRRKGMKRIWKNFLKASAVVAMLVSAIGVAGAQSSQSGQGTQGQPPAQQTDKSKTPEVTPLSLDAL